MDYSKAQLINMARAYHGKVISREHFEKMSETELMSMCHPWDVQRKGKGWGPNGS